MRLVGRLACANGIRQCSTKDIPKPFSAATTLDGTGWLSSPLPSCARRPAAGRDLAPHSLASAPVMAFSSGGRAASSRLRLPQMCCAAEKIERELAVKRLARMSARRLLRPRGIGKPSQGNAKRRDSNCDHNDYRDIQERHELCPGWRFLDRKPRRMRSRYGRSPRALLPHSLIQNTPAG